MTKDIDKQGLEILNVVTQINVTNPATRDLAGSVLLEVKTKQKQVEEAMDPQCKSAYQAWQTTLKQKKKYLKPYQEAEAMLKQAISRYDIERSKIQQKEKLVAIEQARKEEHRLKESLLKKASQAARRGEDDIAESYEDMAENTFVPVVLSDMEPEKSHGISSTKDIEIRVTNTREFLQWVLNSTTIDPDKVVTLKLGTVKNYIKITDTMLVPGLVIEEKSIISVRSN